LGAADSAQSAETPAVAAARAALDARGELARADAVARARLSSKAYARWRRLKQPHWDALYTHIPALAEMGAEHEHLIYEYAHRLRDGGAPIAGAPNKTAAYAAAKRVNPKRYLRSFAPLAEVEAETAEMTDENIDIMDVVSRRLHNHGHRRHTAASRKMLDAYCVRGLGTGLTHPGYVVFFRARVEKATTAQAIALLSAEVAGLEKRYGKVKPGHVRTLLDEYQASLLLLRELEGFAAAPAPTATTSAKPTRYALTKARRVAASGARLAPPHPGKYSPLWFRLQSLETRRRGGEDSPALDADYADYYRELAVATTVAAD
jgi:hypothetical protein